MMSELEYDRATEMEAGWAISGGILLLVAFLCPLFAGPKTIWFTDLLGGQSIPGVRLMAAVPAIAGLIALFAGYMLRGLSRPMVLIFVAGLCNILLLGVTDAYARSLTNMADRVPPQLLASAIRPPVTMILLQLAVTLQFVGLAYTKLRPTARSGPLLAGGAGIGTLLFMVLPLDGVAIKLVFNGDLWSAAWFVPATLLVVLAFAVICICLFLGLGEPEEFAQLGLVVGIAMLLAPGLGILIATLKIGGFVIIAGLTLTLKVWGTFVALHMLFAAGILGWLVHGVQPE